MLLGAGCCRPFDKLFAQTELGDSHAKATCEALCYGQDGCDAFAISGCHDGVVGSCTGMCHTYDLSDDDSTWTTESCLDPALDGNTYCYYLEAPDLASRVSQVYESLDWEPFSVIPPFLIAMRLLAGLCFWFRITKRRTPFPTSVPESHQLGEGKDFKHDLFDFDCMGAFQYVILGCCCPGARLSDTYATAGVGSYWALLFAWEGAFVLARVLQNVFFKVALPVAVARGRSKQSMRVVSHFPFAVASLCMALLLVRKRQALRRRLGDPEPQANWQCDFLCLSFCPCCVIIQEAKQIDEAQNVTVNTCLCLREGSPADGQATVGPPVVVVGAPTATAQSDDGNTTNSSRPQRHLMAV